MTLTGYWLEAAACANADPALFMARNPQGQQRAIDTWCARCPVDAECLADALATPADQDHGVRGGMGRQQRLELRKRPDLPTGRDAVTIAALRQLLDQEQPDVPQRPAPRLKRRTPKETTVPSITTPTETQPEPETTEILRSGGLQTGRTIANLLDWAEAHPEAALRKHAAAARAALAVIQQRHASASELATVQREADELRERLAKLDARVKALKTPAAKRQRDYDPAEVRAWAKVRGMACPPFGVVPKAVVQAWRERDVA